MSFDCVAVSMSRVAVTKRVLLRLLSHQRVGHFARLKATSKREVSIAWAAPKLPHRGLLHPRIHGEGEEERGKTAWYVQARDSQPSLFTTAASLGSYSSLSPTSFSFSSSMSALLSRLPSCFQVAVVVCVVRRRMHRS